jgi:hypothetical protein
MLTLICICNIALHVAGVNTVNANQSEVWGSHSGEKLTLCNYVGGYKYFYEIFITNQYSSKTLVTT